MAERKATSRAGINKTQHKLFTKTGGSAKRKKEAKKEKRVEIWKTLRVSHIPTRQTNNKLFNHYL
jgi:hypothetical protein